MAPVGDSIRLWEARFTCHLVEVGVRRVADAVLITCSTQNRQVQLFDHLELPYGEKTAPLFLATD